MKDLAFCNTCGEHQHNKCVDCKEYYCDNRFLHNDHRCDWCARKYSASIIVGFEAKIRDELKLAAWNFSKVISEE